MVARLQAQAEHFGGRVDHLCDNTTQTIADHHAAAIALWSEEAAVASLQHDVRQACMDVNAAEILQQEVLNDLEQSLHVAPSRIVPQLNCGISVSSCRDRVAIVTTLCGVPKSAFISFVSYE